MRNTNILINNEVDIEKSLEFLGDMEMYDETLEEFLSEIDERIKDLTNYMENADMPNYAILVHSLKSDSKYLGFSKLAEMSLEHELKSKENNNLFVKNNFDNLMKELNKIIQISKEYLNN